MACPLTAVPAAQKPVLWEVVLPMFMSGPSVRRRLSALPNACDIALARPHVPLYTIFSRMLDGGPRAQERFYFGDTVLPLFESGIPLVRERLQALPDAANITIAYPDEGAWKRFHYQFGDYPEVGWRSRPRCTPRTHLDNIFFSVSGPRMTRLGPGGSAAEADSQLCCTQKHSHSCSALLHLVDILSQSLYTTHNACDVTENDIGAWSSAGHLLTCTNGWGLSRRPSAARQLKCQRPERAARAAAGDLHKGARRRQAHRAAEGGRGQGAARGHRGRPGPVRRHADRVPAPAHQPGAPPPPPPPPSPVIPKASQEHSRHGML